jgi:hypothetical protein
MARQQPIYINLQRNQLKPCSVPGCTETRHRVAANCYDHEMKRMLYGHPEGRPLHPREYSVERQDVSRLIRSNADHPGIQYALQRIARLLSGREPVGRSSLARHLTRLYDAAVKPEAVLTEAAALWLWSSRNPALLPDDIRLEFAIGAAVLRLAPLERTVSWRSGRSYSVSAKTGDRRDLGHLIRNQLGPLLHNLTLTIHREEEQRRSMAQALALPLNH